MCPACLATTAWAFAGIGGTGGLTLLLARKLRAVGRAKRITPSKPEPGEPK